jgi:hypothetical protein
MHLYISSISQIIFLFSPNSRWRAYAACPQNAFKYLWPQPSSIAYVKLTDYRFHIAPQLTSMITLITMDILPLMDDEYGRPEWTKSFNLSAY